MAQKQGYAVAVAGPGHNFERPIDGATAGQILALIMTGTATPAGGNGTGAGGAGARGGASSQAGASSQTAANVSKGYCEKRKDGSFFITPEGIEALDQSASE